MALVAAGFALVELGFAAASEIAPPADCESRDLGGGVFFVRGHVDIGATPEQVYAVVADFDHAADFVSAMDSSRVLSQDSDGVLVRQVGTTHFLVRHTVRLALRFRESPPSLLRFEIVGGDFAVYYGSWKTAPQDGGTRLQYEVTLRPPGFVPQFLVRPLAERILCQTLEEVRGEVQRREPGHGVAPDSSAAPAEAR